MPQVIPMKSIRSVNICWEKRFRGSYPVSRFALNDTGSLCIAVPRPLESRTYDITRLSLDGGIETGNSFSVETLIRLEITNSGGQAIGMTADDLYLFTGESKNKFLAERRLSYIDGMVSENGERVAAGFSDLNGTSFALAYGHLTGKASWTRDVDVPLTAIAISRDGNRITIGTELGMMWQIDAARRDMWEFEQKEPIRALASSSDGNCVVFGTASGVVGCLDSEGARLWETHLPGEISLLAISGDGSICAAVSPPNGETPGRITCLSGRGSIGWEFEPEKPVKGLSVSPNGRYLAMGTRDGLQSVYEIVLGEAGSSGLNGSADVRAILEKARLEEEAGDLETAFNILVGSLSSIPTSAELAEESAKLRDRRAAAGFLAAEKYLEDEDYTSAINSLARLAGGDPQNQSILTRYHQALDLGITAKMDEVKRLLSEERLDAADSALLKIIEWNPYLLEPREALRNLRAKRSEQEAADAVRMLETGKVTDAVAALERASTLDGSEAISAKLELAKTRLEFELGMEHYNEKRYREAIFQFKKVLIRDAGNAEASRYLGYAQKFLQDAGGETITDRFSKLE